LRSGGRVKYEVDMLFGWSTIQKDRISRKSLMMCRFNALMLPSVNGEKRRLPSVNGEKRRLPSVNGEKRRLPSVNGEKRRT
jgi:hypothetical protein